MAEAKLREAELGRERYERDTEVHQLGSRIRTLRRFGLDLCLGYAVVDGEPVWIGRQGLKSPAGEQLLIDWRSPAAAPFFAATHSEPMGVSRRRRYLWQGGRVRDFWDEVLDFDDAGGPAMGTSASPALDEQSSFLASLASSRTDTMRDVVATIQSDQDAIIRAESQQALVVDGGPGTGKTVVALHRAAYLLYSDPLLRGNGLLFVGPHERYVSYVSDVLPSLGEEGVKIRTLGDLLPEGALAGPETDAEALRCKGSLEALDAIAKAVAFYEEPPNLRLVITDEDFDNTLVEPADWIKAFASREIDATHNDAREQIWESLLDAILIKHREQKRPMPRVALNGDVDLRGEFNKAWPLVAATDLIGDLLTVPAYLRHCWPGAPACVLREAPDAWTVADLPLIDHARRLLGEPDDVRRRHRRSVLRRTDRLRHAEFLEEYVNAAAEDEEAPAMMADAVERMLADEESALDLEVWQDERPPAENYAHLIVDEAQELSDCEWRMALARCPSQSATVVGDRAQARRPFPEAWDARLGRVGLGKIGKQSLTVNYRTPAEVMEVAAPVIRSVLPDANVPRSVRSSGVAVRAAGGDPVALALSWLAENEGIACVIGGSAAESPDRRLAVLSPEGAKGLEFDLVVVALPPDATYADAVDRYVAYTRATRELVLVEP